MNLIEILTMKTSLYPVSNEILWRYSKLMFVEFSIYVAYNFRVFDLFFVHVQHTHSIYLFLGYSIFTGIPSVHYTSS